MELALFVTWCFLVALAGGLVGLVLGNLRLAATVFIATSAAAGGGTNVTVGVCVGVAGALAHLPNAAPDLDVVVVGGAASVPGALLGSRLTGRLSDRDLVRAIGAVLLVAVAGCLAQAVT